MVADVKYSQTEKWLFYSFSFNAKEIYVFIVTAFGMFDGIVGSLWKKDANKKWLFCIFTI